jgi:hypothetical protein
MRSTRLNRLKRWMDMFINIKNIFKLRLRFLVELIRNVGTFRVLEW